MECLRYRLQERLSDPNENEVLASALDPRFLKMRQMLFLPQEVKNRYTPSKLVERMVNELAKLDHEELVSICFPGDGDLCITSLPVPEGASLFEDTFDLADAIKTVSRDEIKRQSKIQDSFGSCSHPSVTAYFRSSPI